jgi:hypothetical protein
MAQILIRIIFLLLDPEKKKKEFGVRYYRNCCYLSITTRRLSVRGVRSFQSVVSADFVIQNLSQARYTPSCVCEVKYVLLSFNNQYLQYARVK